MNSRSDANKAYKAVKDEVTRLVKALQLEEGDPTGEEGKWQQDKIDAEIESAVNAFRSEEVENLTTYVEDFFNEFYTVNVRERNGKYTTELEPTELARYAASNDDIQLFSEDEGVGFLLTTLVDTKSDETYYDLLVDGRTDADKLMDTVAEIEEVKIGNSFTTSDAEKILAAKRAFNELLPEDGSNPYGLTSKEKREVRSHEDLIDSLHLKLIMSGTVVKDWWQFENGQWVFYDNGRTVSNKWVADANNNWFYAGENGVMLTNAWVWRDATSAYYVGEDGAMVYGPTTIDGYAIDANGLWHA